VIVFVVQRKYRESVPAGNVNDVLGLGEATSTDVDFVRENLIEGYYQRKPCWPMHGLNLFGMHGFGPEVGGNAQGAVTGVSPSVDLVHGFLRREVVHCTNTW
jgi:hypothetical protein